MNVAVESKHVAVGVGTAPEPLNVKPAQPASTPARRLLAPVAGVTAILLGCKLAGFSEKIVVAHYLGTSRDADAYYAAFAVVWMVVFILRELLQPAFMPVYVRSLGAPAPLSGRLITGVLAVLVPLIVGIAAVLALWPAALIRLAAPGFDPNVQRQTGELLRAMSVGTAGLTFMGLTHVILNAHARFCWAVAGDLLFRIVFVGGLVGGFVVLGGNHAGLALAAGAVGGLLLHIVIVSRHAQPAVPCATGGLPASEDTGGQAARGTTRGQAASGTIRGRARLRLDRSTRNGLTEMLALAAPLAVGVFCSHLGQIVDGVLASMLAPGRLSALAYARKLTDAMVLLGPVALGTVLFSHFSSLAAAGRVEEMRSLLVRCARVVLAVSLFISVLVVILREPLVGILFQHGRFSAQSTQLTAVALAGYGVGLAAFALDGIVVSSFYALRDMKTPVLLGVGGVLIELSIAWGLMDRMDHLAIALGASISKVVKVTALWWLLMRKLDRLPKQTCLSAAE